LYRKPLHEVAQWPAADIGLLESYLARQPAPEERIDIGIAGLRALLVNYLRAPTARTATVRDFLPYFNPWENVAPSANDARYSDLDREVIAAFGK
jgi:hypothetical protein